MNERQKDKEAFVVECSWCGATIRDDKEKEATGVCLKCFYQILSNHLQAQKSVVAGEFVSER